MRKVQYDLEILYVYKLYYFFSLLVIFLAVGLILNWRFGQLAGTISFAAGFLLSYLLMMRKRSFPPPDKKLTAQKMAKEITQDPSPLSIAHFASQLYFYFNETRQAISLLERYQNTQDPLLCATLADILLREGRPHHALKAIRNNPYLEIDPLLLFILGHIFLKMNNLQDAVRIYKQSLSLARKSGFPRNGTSRLTQFLLTLSYTAHIHHSLGDCYVLLKDYPKAKKHYILGNIRFFDISLWRKIKPPSTHPA